MVSHYLRANTHRILDSITGSFFRDKKGISTDQAAFVFSEPQNFAVFDLRNFARVRVLVQGEVLLALEALEVRLADLAVRVWALILRFAVSAFDQDRAQAGGASFHVLVADGALLVLALLALVGHQAEALLTR